MAEVLQWANGKLMRIIVAMAVLAVGCAANVPGDGRLVAVSIDPSIADVVVGSVETRCTGGVCTTIQPRTVASYAAEGLHLWDAVGAQLRLEREIGNELPAARISIVAESSSPAGDDWAAWWSPIDGNIHVVWPMQGAGDQATPVLFAHEAGHAMGLGHVDDGNGADFSFNVMDPNVSGLAQLGPLDRAEFHARWR